MMKNNLKNKKTAKKSTRGITLIALVVTIIVLLILAGISISMLSGDNGILTRTTQAKEATRGGEVQERVRLEVAYNTSSDYLGGAKKYKEQVVSELHTEKKLTDEEVKTLEKSDVITIGGITIDFSVLGSAPKGKKLVEMFRQAQKDGCTNENGTCDNADHLHIGDYVNYTNPTSGEYKVDAGVLGGDEDQIYLVSQNQLNWRVLGMEGEGDNAYIKLIAGSPMKKSKANKNGVDDSNPYLYMKGAKAYKNAVTELNNICEKYKTDIAQEAKSVNMDDIDKLTGVTTDALKKQYNVVREPNYGESYSFQDQYDPDSWLATPRTTKEVKGTVDGYAYAMSAPEGFPVTTVPMSNTRAYNMLFDNVQMGTGRPYWLASVGVIAVPDSASFSPACVGEVNGLVVAGTCSLFHSYGDEDVNAFAVRPVVSLKSGVTNEQCPKTGD